MDYTKIKSEQEPLGLQGCLLIFCVVQLYIAIYFPIFGFGIKGVSQLNLVIFTFFLFSIYQVVIKREKACIHSFDYIILVYIFYCLLSIIYSCYSNGYSYVEELILFKNRLLNHFIIYFLLKNAIGNIRQARALLTTLIVALVLLSTFGILANFFWQDAFISTSGRTRAIFECSNTFGMFIVLTSPLLIIVAQPRDSIIKFVKMLSIILVMITLIKTGSRAAFLSQCVILGLIFWESKQKSRAVVGGIVAFVMLFALLNFTTLGEKTVFTRLQMEEGKECINYDGGRFAAWQASFREYLKKPFLGYGFNSFMRAFALQFAGKKFAAHNQYLDNLFNLGILGLILFVLIYYKIWAFLSQYDDLIVARACRYGITGYLVAITFQNLTDVRYTLWIVLAVVLRFIDLEKNKTRDMNIIGQPGHWQADSASS